MSHAYPNLSLFIAGHIIAPSGVRKSSIKIGAVHKLREQDLGQFLHPPKNYVNIG